MNKWLVVKMKWIFLAGCCLVLSSAVFGQVRFRLRPYLGIGLSRIIDGNAPSFEIDDMYDQFYYDWNLSSLRRFFLQGQLRLDFLEIWNFSFGYLFWSHQYEYPSDDLEYWAKENKFYPYSYSYSLHGCVLQWNARYASVFTEYFMPFVVVGSGWFYGLSEHYFFHFEETGDPQFLRIDKIVSMAEEYDGWAILYGAGTVIFKYLYVYVGMIDLRKDRVPERRFINVFVGITI